MSNTGFFVVGKTLNFGFPGTASKSGDNITRNRPVDASVTNGIAFGAPVVLNSTNHTWQPFGSSNVAADFSGIAVREVVQGTNYLASYSTGNYAALHPCDVLERGSCVVTCTEGTPVEGQAIYIVTTAGSVSPVGSICATATPAGSGVAVQIPGVVWTTGAIDANNTAEITIKTRVQA